MSILLIYEMVPEDTKLYLLPDQVADQYREHLENAQGRMINCDDLTESMSIIQAAIAERRDDVEEEFLEHASVFSQYIHSKKAPIVSQISKVYCTGCVM